MNTGKVLLGILTGLAVGATIGILFAPEKGSSTRKKISKKSKKYAEEWGGSFNEFMDTMTRKFESLRAEAIRMAENGLRKAEEMDTTTKLK